MRELELLEHVYGHNAALPARVTIGPGDDMGALRIGGGGDFSDVLVTVDQVADGVHFDSATAPLAKVGRKAITRNLSDVAAMGAVPAGAVVAAALPQDFGKDRANALFDAMRATGDEYGCALFGGDITIWDRPLLISVTVLAEDRGIKPLRRVGAKVGDVVCVTGALGGSLQTLAGYTHHLDFRPRLREGRALAETGELRPHCMIDLSDGLATDLCHLCRAGGVSAVIDADRLPINTAAKVAAGQSGQAAWRHAMADGEDYELCFTVTPQQADRLVGGEVEGVAVTAVGNIMACDDRAVVMVRTPDGGMEDISDSGWQHHG